MFCRIDSTFPCIFCILSLGLSARCYHLCFIECHFVCKFYVSEALREILPTSFFGILAPFLCVEFWKQFPFAVFSLQFKPAKCFFFSDAECDILITPSNGSFSVYLTPSGGKCMQFWSRVQFAPCNLNVTHLKPLMSVPYKELNSRAHIPHTRLFTRSLFGSRWGALLFCFESPPKSISDRETINSSTRK